MEEHTESLTLSVDEAALQLGIGRSLAYDLARRGELPGVLRLGRRLVVSRAMLDQALGVRTELATMEDSRTAKR